MWLKLGVLLSTYVKHSKGEGQKMIGANAMEGIPYAPNIAHSVGVNSHYICLTLEKHIGKL